GAGPLVRRWPGALGPVPGLVWVAQEALRDRTPFGGFPWARLAFSQQDSPLVRLAAAGGAPLVTFGVGLAGGLLAAGLLVGVSLRTHPALDRARPRLAIGARARLPLVVVLAGVAPAGGSRGGGSRGGACQPHQRQAGTRRVRTGECAPAGAGVQRTAPTGTA